MNNKRILIIGDDHELCEEIVDLFNAEGYDAVGASDPMEGLALLEKDGHGTILLDYKMPGLTGADIVKRIRSKNLKSRIFIVSGKPFVEKIIKEDGLSDMISAVIPKPIDFGKLVKKIASSLSGA